MITYGLLGPLEVRRDGTPIEVGGQQRALLTLLALDAGRVVSVERIIDALWPDDPPASATSSIQALVSRLRTALRDGEDRELPIRRRAPGYVLETAPDAVDLPRFLAGCDAVRALVADRRWAEAADRAAAAVALRRGPLVVEHADEPWVRPSAVLVEERLLAALEDRATALLALGRDDEALGVAARARELGPLDERACRLHVLALHRTGRTADALAAWRAFADVLDDELGLEPGPELRALQNDILRQDPALLAWPEATRAAAPPRRAPATAPQATRLVGRDDELRRLDAVRDAAHEGGEAWIVVMGRPGIGKSALTEEAVLRWTAAGGTAARVGCPDDAALPAFWPLRRLLAELGADPDAVLEPPSRDDPDLARFAIAAQVREVLAARADRPLLVVVDDVQWSDPSTAALLAQLAETERTPRLAVLLASREDPREPAVQRLLTAVARRPDAVRLDPAPLTDSEVAELVTRISSAAPEAAELAELTRRTEGMPFFVTEYARLPEHDRRSGALPSGVRTVLERRLAAVSPAVRTALQAAAVLADPIDPALLATVTGLDLLELADLLDAATDEHLVTSDPDTGAYAFAHALMREQLEAAMSPVRRQDLHRRAGAALAERTGSVALARRARHLVAARSAADPAVVAAVCIAAARDAERRWSSDEAVRWWQEALDVLDVAGADPAGRDEVVLGLASALVRSGQGQRMLQLVDESLLEAWRNGRLDSVGHVAGLLLRLTGSWPWPAYGADPGPLIARLAGLEPRLREAPGARARVLSVLAIGSCYDLDPAVPDSLSARAIALAESTGDPDVLADTLLGRSLSFGGVAVRSQEVLDLLDRLARTPHALERFDSVIADGIGSISTMTLGDIPAATEQIERGLEHAATLHLPVLAAQLRWGRESLKQWHSDDVAAVEAAFDETWRLHSRTELSQAVTWILARLALRWEQGRLAEGLGLPDRNAFLSPWIDAIVAAERGDQGSAEGLVREVLRPEPQSWTAHGRAALLAHAAADAGVVEAVEPLRALLLPISGCLVTFGHTSFLGPVGLALARLDLLAGDLDAASAHLDVATDLARRTGGGNALLRCRLERARLASASGEEPDEQELAAIAASATARGLDGVARDARALLQESSRRIA